MRQLCVCGIYQIDTENADYVKDGVPMCPEATCAKVREHRDMTRVPFFDDAEHEEDRMPREVYGRNRRYEDI